MEIVKNKFDGEMIDVMEGCNSWDIKIGDLGSCSLIDCLPRLVPAGRTCDAAIVRAARTSTGQGLKSVAEDRNLIRYMYSHLHSSPFESCEFSFHQVMPIFVARQFIRHRTSSVSEFSARYANVKDRFWFPKADELRAQSLTNKQATDGSVSLEVAGEFIEDLMLASSDAMADYQKALKGGIGRELARTILPINLMTEWIWKCDLNNILKFLGLRQDKHAQAEIRVYADAMYELLKPLAPAAIEAYDDYHVNRGGMSLSNMEVCWIAGDQKARERMTTREIDEFYAKAARLGIEVMIPEVMRKE